MEHRTVPNYRRNRVPGGTYFFTFALQDRRSALLVKHIDILRCAVRQARAHKPFVIDAWVVLPNHMHCIWTLPDGDADYSSRWQAIKAGFTSLLPDKVCRPGGRPSRRELGIWQPRFWEHTIRDERDYASHMDYTLFNPVKHRLAPHPASWPFSSFRLAVAAGLYPADWSGPEDSLDTVSEPQPRGCKTVGRA
jgi:putative transposase